MKNASLALASQTIPYIKEVRKIAGSVTAAILLQQLEFRFYQRKGRAFYKFAEACKSEYYKDGDSWCEELGFSIDEFRNAFSKIGIAYKSKRDYEEADEPFERDGKSVFYISVFNKSNYLTTYFRNHKITDEAIHNMFNPPIHQATPPIPVDGLSQSTGMGKPNLRWMDFPNPPLYTETNYQETTPEDEDSFSFSFLPKVFTLLNNSNSAREDFYVAHPTLRSCLTGISSNYADGVPDGIIFDLPLLKRFTALSQDALTKMTVEELGWHMQSVDHLAGHSYFGEYYRYVNDLWLPKRNRQDDDAGMTAARQPTAEEIKRYNL